ncbi:MAG: DUF1835 domain-containing protein [Bacteroidia bacterium]|nr:DUF1835 domain-containing protein [Bacteroidia bacterium]
MNYHILNGDELARKFDKNILGDLIVCRECMVEGPLDAPTQEAFWGARAAFFAEEYEAYDQELGYNGPGYDAVVAEFSKLLNTDHTSEVYLWFEHDLFCQANMWFCLDFIRRHTPATAVYWVPPPDQIDAHRWCGFGPLNTLDLQHYFDSRIPFTEDDLQLGLQLWGAFRTNDHANIMHLASAASPCFPRLAEVCRAHVSRFPSLPGGLGRPQQRLKELMMEGIDNFPQLFQAFSKTEGVYGFGDLQVKRLLISPRTTDGATAPV